MGSDCGDSFPFDFEPNGITFDSKSKENRHHDHIPLNGSGAVITRNYAQDLNVIATLVFGFNSQLLFLAAFVIEVIFPQYLFTKIERTQNVNKNCKLHPMS